MDRKVFFNRMLNFESELTLLIWLLRDFEIFSFEVKGLSYRFLMRPLLLALHRKNRRMMRPMLQLKKSRNWKTG